jgi:hypothetical protein
VEGVPSVLLGTAVLLYLPNGPLSAKWLKPEELAADCRPRRRCSSGQYSEVDYRIRNSSGGHQSGQKQHPRYQQESHGHLSIACT